MADRVKRLFDAFNRRDFEGIVELCNERMEFRAVTAERLGRDAPYTGVAGLRAYLADVASAWEELLVTPSRIVQRGERVLVRGRVYLRSRALGIRDVPAGWIWELEAGRFVRGEVFVELEDAVRRFSREARREPSRGLRASRSTTPPR